MPVPGKPARNAARKHARDDAPGVRVADGKRATPAQLLARLGLANDLDLVLHLPLRYEDETRIASLGTAPEGVARQFEAEVVSAEVGFRPRRQLLVRIADGSGEAMLRFYNFYPGQQKALVPGARLRVFGELRRGFFGGEIIHPRFRVVRAGEPLPASLTPVYPVTAGLAQGALRRMIDAALGRVLDDAKGRLAETIPDALRERLGLMPLAEALRYLHRPPPGADLALLGERRHPAWRRVQFDELLAQQISMRRHVRARMQRRAPVMAGNGRLVSALLARLPWQPTGAQTRAWSQIEADLARRHPMHRLLQGDVGSGKTVVAALAAARAAECGLQTAVMAPTELLAEQHQRKFREWLEPLGLAVVWLTGSQSRAEREAGLAAIASGAARVAVGTHALFQDAVRFHRLGLAIVDEQHRFGVGQRLALREKGAAKGGENGGENGGEKDETRAPHGLEPHLLMMSATPIPRTLSMSYLADLEVSVIDELPPGRMPVVTKLVAAGKRGEVLRRIRDACAAGTQAYWVCPLIEESEHLELQTAIDTHAALAAELPGIAVGLLHGRMAPADKAGVMAEFAAGRIQLLVATTVIEVGVDVPNASLMVIEHAERFGLAQLHQLRGRVGRGSAESVCILLYQGPLSETARKRLRVIHANTDGFAIAREDLLMRGPGEFLGARQSGAPLLRFADPVAQEDLLDAVRAAADELLEREPEAAERHLARWLGGRAEFLRA